MMFGKLSWVDQRNHVIDGAQSPMGRGNFERKVMLPDISDDVLP